MRKFWYRLIKKSPAEMEMVNYWKTKEAVAAKIMKANDGSIIMRMEGEKYPFPTFPRGHILFGGLSKLKHEIKNQIFNDSWYALKRGDDRKEVIRKVKEKLFVEIPKYFEKFKYDVLPPRSMCPAVREIYRAWAKVSPETVILRDYLCFILQEDDAYRFRVSWLVDWFGWFSKRKPIKSFDYALKMLEHGEVIGDMKERMRLLRRILMLALEDEGIKNKFIRFFKEVDWEKVKLTNGDRYHFRGKYFKVDLKYFDY